MEDIIDAIATDASASGFQCFEECYFYAKTGEKLML